jgi:hypothetical protein
MIDGGVISGYLALAVARGVDRFVSNKIDAILVALENRVKAAMGVGPSRDLRADPTDPQVQNMVARAIERRAQRDTTFARDLASLRDRLDREGGRPLLRQVWTGGPVSVGHGNSVQAQYAGGDVAGGNINKTHVRHPSEMYDKPVLVRAGYWISGILALVGFGLLFYSFFKVFSAGEPARGVTPAWIMDNTYVTQGAVCFFVGLTFAILSSLGASMSRPRR